MRISSLMINKLSIVIVCYSVYSVFFTLELFQKQETVQCFSFNYEKKNADLYFLDSLSKLDEIYNYQKYHNAIVKKLEKGRITKNLELQIFSHILIAEYYDIKNYKGKSFKHIGLANKLLTVQMKGTYIHFLLKYKTAMLLMRCNELDQSLKLFSETLAIFDDYSCNDKYLNRFHIYNYIASIYLKKKDKKKVLEFYNKALNESEIFGNDLEISSAYNNIGYYHYLNANYTQAKLYFIKAKKELNSKKHPLFFVNIKENLAHLEVQKFNFHKALNMYSEVEEVRVKYQNAEFDILSKINQYGCYINFNNHKIINSIDNTVSNYFNHRDIVLDDILFRYYQKFVSFKLKYLTKNNFLHEKIEFQQEIIEKLKLNKQNDINNHKIVRSDFIKIQEENFNKQLELEKEVYSKNQKSLRKKNIYSLITIALILLIVVVLLILIRIKNFYLKNQDQLNKLNQLELKETIHKKEELSMELSSLTNRVDDIVISSGIKRDLLRGILKKINNLSSSKNTSNEIKKISLDIKSKILIEERLMALYQNDSKTNLIFVQNLIKKYPKLTKTEREVCTLIKLNLSNKEIAQIRGTTIASVKMSRSRIRKKMGLSTKNELNKFIQNL